MRCLRILTSVVLPSLALGMGMAMARGGPAGGVRVWCGHGRSSSSVCVAVDAAALTGWGREGILLAGPSAIVSPQILKSRSGYSDYEADNAI